MAQGQVGMGVYLVEGIVEQDPMSDRFTLRTVGPDGKPFTFDPQAVLGQLKGQEVRIVIAPMATVEHVEQLVQAQQNEGQNVQVGEKIELSASLVGSAKKRD